MFDEEFWVSMSALKSPAMIFEENWGRCRSKIGKNSVSLKKGVLGGRYTDAAKISCFDGGIIFPMRNSMEPSGSFEGEEASGTNLKPCFK